MNGFGFIEYKDAMDARDVVPAFALLLLINLHPAAIPFRCFRLYIHS